MIIFIFLIFFKFSFASVCNTYTVQSGDTCYQIAQNNDISVDDIENFNKLTYGWFGCTDLQLNFEMCISSGDPPTSDMECSMNIECPINACCSKYGYCGMTSDFCEDNCYSNCGLPDTPSGSVSNFITSAYWLDDTDFDDDGSFDTIFYAFAEISSDLTSVVVKDNFDVFTSISNSKKILSIGGWDFSTSTDTYNIMRQAILVNNRPSVGQVISDFVINNNLDGVNFDWEYPGEPDIPNIPAGSEDDGPNYSGLVETVKNNLGGDYEVSVAIPASFWYLKHFPLSTMKEYLDYFVFMNYDYCGEWDYGKANTGLCCHVDQTTTVEALKMLNKAQVPMSKVYGGLASYGRSFVLSDTNCVNYMCGFTGPDNTAMMGEYSQTPGILYEDEIDQLDSGSFNSTSKCFYTTYNNGLDWVAWMKDSDRGYLTTDVFIPYGLGGTALWAINYETSYINDNTNDTFDDFADPTYVDIYDCKNSLNNAFGCHYEIANEFIISNVTESIKQINTILDDYDNYLIYYNNFIQQYFDDCMKSYIEWMFGDNNAAEKYFTYPNKVTKRELFSYKNVTNINPRLRVGVPSGNELVYKYLIEDDQKQNAIDDFNSIYGYNLTTDVFITTDKPREFSGNDEDFHYTFEDSTIFDDTKLFPNILENINQNNITQITNIITKATNAEFNEFGSDIYESIELTLIYSEIADIAEFTYNEGKKITEEEVERKKLFIIEIIFGFLGIGAMFIGPVAEIITDIAFLITLSATEKNIDPETFILGIFSIFSPMLSEINIGRSFSRIFDEFADIKAKNYSNLNNFKYIKEIRQSLGKTTCS